MKALRLSMERFGYLTPIVVDQNNLIADGEHRALIYKEFGLKKFPLTVSHSQTMPNAACYGKP